MPIERNTQGHRIQGQALRQRSFDGIGLADLRPTVPEHDIHPHQHEDMHLLVLLDGAYVSSARGMPAVCTTPEVLINPPGTEHRDRFRSRDGRFLTLSMPATQFEDWREGSGIGEAALRLPSASLRTALGLLRELAIWDDASPLAVGQALAQLLDDARSPSSACREPGPGLQRALDRLDESALPAPALPELAAISGLHPVYFARAFRRRTGLSPGEYLRRRRLHAAMPLIVRGLALADIAACAGFSDQSHLHRCFLREFGLTPGALQRLALGRGEVSRVQDKLAARPQAVSSPPRRPRCAP